MVGVPRSTGCARCVKRRVRCDETRPACRNCARYGVECPGFERSFKFLGAKHAGPSSPRQRQAPTPSPPATATTARQSLASERTASEAAIPADLRPSRGAMLVPLAQSLWDPDNAAEFLHFRSWFEGVADRLGSKTTLDSAACAFALHVRAKNHGDSTALARAQTAYVTSLAELQNALYHPTEWRSSETLCAAMFLCLYESFAGSSSSVSWMKHASGVGRLVQLRGPGAHHTAWDASMLEAFRGLLIMYSLFSLQDCFLAREKWRQIFRGRDARPESALIEQFWNFLSVCPSIVRQAHDQRQRRRRGEYVPEEQTLALSQEAETLRNQLVQWHETLSTYTCPPQELVSQSPNALYSTMYSFPTVWLASLIMGYWATLLILQTVLGECQYPIDFTMSNRQLLENILKSVECASKGIMGPYRTGYSIRVAVEFVDLETRKKITSLLGHMSSSFAAVAPTSNSGVLPPLFVGNYRY